MEIPETTTSLLGYARWGIDKLREIIFFLAEFISKYIEFPAGNIYALLMIIFSLWIAKKIFMLRMVTVQGRIVEYIILAIVIYFILTLI